MRVAYNENVTGGNMSSLASHNRRDRPTRRLVDVMFFQGVIRSVRRPTLVQLPIVRAKRKAWSWSKRREGSTLNGLRTCAEAGVPLLTGLGVLLRPLGKRARGGRAVIDTSVNINRLR